MYGNNGVYTMKEGSDRNGAPIWEFKKSATESRFLYLHGNNWWHVFTKDSGKDAVNFNRRLSSSANCPGRETDWYYWENDAINLATDTSMLNVVLKE